MPYYPKFSLTKKNLTRKKNIMVKYHWTKFFRQLRKKKNVSKSVEIRCEIELKKLNYFPMNNISQHAPIKNIHKELETLITQKWENDWKCNQQNTKLFSIKPEIQEWKTALRKNKNEGTHPARLKIGHSLVTYSYLLNRTLQPTCKTC